MRGRKPKSKSVENAFALRLPNFSTPEARKEWLRVKKILTASSVISDADQAVLGGYAAAYARWAEAERLVTQYGLLIEETSTSRAGITTTRLKRNPATTISNQAQQLMLRYVAALGLSPADRTRIQQAASEPEDDIAALLTPPELDVESQQVVVIDSGSSNRW